MSSILWTQSPSLNSPDKFVINGVVQESTGTPEQQEAFSMLTRKNKAASHSLSYWKQRFPGCSPSLSMFVDHNEQGGSAIVVQSHLTDLDDKGRKIPMAFYCDDFSIAVGILRQYAGLAAVNLNQDDLNVIEKVLKMRRNRKIAIIGGVIVVGLISLAICS